MIVTFEVASPRTCDPVATVTVPGGWFGVVVCVACDPPPQPMPSTQEQRAATPTILFIYGIIISNPRQRISVRDARKTRLGGILLSTGVHKTRNSEPLSDGAPHMPLAYVGVADYSAGENRTRIGEIGNTE